MRDRVSLPFQAENSALLLANESQRDAYERCLDEVSRSPEEAGLVLCSGVTSPLLSRQVANHVVQALLNQKVSLRFCRLARLS